MDTSHSLSMTIGCHCEMSPSKIVAIHKRTKCVAKPPPLRRGFCNAWLATRWVGVGFWLFEFGFINARYFVILSLSTKGEESTL